MRENFSPSTHSDSVGAGRGDFNWRAEVNGRTTLQIQPRNLELRSEGSVSLLAKPELAVQFFLPGLYSCCC